MEAIPQKRTRYVYDLTDLETALKYVKLDIKFVIKKLKICETKEFRIGLNKCEIQQQTSKCTIQLRSLLTIRDSIIEQINHTVL